MCLTAQGRFIYKYFIYAPKNNNNALFYFCQPYFFHSEMAFNKLLTFTKNTPDYALES